MATACKGFVQQAQFGFAAQPQQQRVIEGLLVLLQEVPGRVRISWLTNGPMALSTMALNVLPSRLLKRRA